MGTRVAPNATLKEAEELTKCLTEALSVGDEEEAVALTRKLCRLSLPVCVSVRSQAYPQESIRLVVGVEDAKSDAATSVSVMVSCGMTVSQLKDKINKIYGFHPTLQRWVIGKRLARDHDTLYSHGIRSDGDWAFLFIVSAHAAHFTSRQQRLNEEQRPLQGIAEETIKVIPRANDGKKSPSASLPTQFPPHPGPPPSAPPPPPQAEPLPAQPGWVCPSCTFINEPTCRGCRMCSAEKPEDYRVPEAHKPPPPPPPRPLLHPPPPPRVEPLPPQLGWMCPTCTFVNEPTRPGCRMCSAERPEDYRVPEAHQPVGEEAERLEKEMMAVFFFEEVENLKRLINYSELRKTDDLNIVPNTSESTCPICFCDLEQGMGIVLRECLHAFCRECLRGTIMNCEDAEVSCPEQCDMKLVDREIKALLTEQEYERFLEQRLSVAESRLQCTFHCRTADCRGWCIYEDEVNEFHCELCGRMNCIICRAIHDNMNCQEYQEDLRIRAQNDNAAQQTQNLLKLLLQSGKAMNCPQCDIIIQKRDGCDWVCCSVCRMEICWVTKQARWGPNGRGDTSGGCKCRVNNKPCHPNCLNCH
ncbi:ranBP-type and C3HC4-type zinc finger-containing protein 1 isoform X2 [Syngnathoides biaculeatus]|uniref:ranBP-type and C3HC4-type zinc finger-containing protein 1 isoform X2 n=1 Tax=Syngnathoides biaculeatus TaxID=300417 RepID=UPI002ADD70D1|nr:ranBP-type and C3HC4-type zinc finger-containing protein 1 isoform X2 [Syngnathoides biaculeatus]